MTSTLAPPWIDRLLRQCEERYGIRVGPGRRARLEQHIEGRSAQLGVEPETLVRSLAFPSVAHGEWEAIVTVITTGQTSFFRDEPQLHAVGRVLADRSRPAQIWCAGCSTGEEAYSLAIIAREHGHPCGIVATDINPQFLEHARTGVYELARIESLDPVRQAGFVRHGERVRVPASLAERVAFRRHNLLEDELPTASSGRGWDLIMCRNVFIYFERSLAARIVTRMANALAYDGWLVLGAADPLCNHVGGLELTDVGGQLLYRRRPPIAATPPTISSSPDLPPSRRAEPPRDESDILRGNACLASHDFDRALAIYDTVIERSPLSADVHCLRGVVYRKQGELQMAKHALRQALFLEPRFWPAAYLLASCFEREGQHELARAHYRQVQTLLEDGDALAFRVPLADAGLGLSPDAVLDACRQVLGSRSE